MKKVAKSEVSGVAFPLKAYTVKSLAEVYGVSAKTFRRWLAPFHKKIGEKQGYFYSISQVKSIVEHLGIPGNVIVD